MCHPGKPLPHGLSHSICRFSPGAENFHRAKSDGFRFSPRSTRLPAFLPLEVEPREIAVVRLLRRVEIDAVRRPVGEAVLLDVRDEVDLLADVVGRAAQHRRILDVEQLHVGDERIGVELRDFPRRLARAPRALLHLVLAGVGVRREMADVGDVHHVPHAVRRSIRARASARPRRGTCGSCRCAGSRRPSARRCRDRPRRRRGEVRTDATSG